VCAIFEPYTDVLRDAHTNETFEIMPFINKEFERRRRKKKRAVKGTNPNQAP
jgi:hypothetical protein